MKYRLKSDEVDAVQWWPPGDERRDPMSMPIHTDIALEDGYEIGHVYVSMFYPTKWLFYKGRRKWTQILPGDWIVTKPDGSICRVLQDEFESNYEKVD